MPQITADLAGKPRRFGSARPFAEEPATADATNHAINVWSVPDGIAGFVRKPGHAIPHAGFLVEPYVLIWCALLSGRAPRSPAVPPATRRSSSSRGRRSWGTGRPGAYAVRGAAGSARLSAAGAIGVVGRFGAVEHRGDYRSVIHVRDGGSLWCAIARGELAGNDPEVARKVVAKLGLPAPPP